MVLNHIVLLIDDDAVIRAALVDLFQNHGFESVHEADNIEAGIASARQMQPDIIIVHVSDQSEAFAAIKASRLDIPLIMLGGSPKLAAAEAVCMAKPFRFVDLVARVRGLIGSHENDESMALRFGDGLVFRPALRALVTASGERIAVTEMEADILRYLHKIDGRTVSRKQLLAEIWGYNKNVRTHTLATHIHRLRRKIEKDPSNPAILVTDGDGYRLVIAASD